MVSFSGSWFSALITVPDKQSKARTWNPLFSERLSKLLVDKCGTAKLAALHQPPVLSCPMRGSEVDSIANWVEGIKNQFQLVFIIREDRPWLTTKLDEVLPLPKRLTSVVKKVVQKSYRFEQIKLLRQFVCEFRKMAPSAQILIRGQGKQFGVVGANVDLIGTISNEYEQKLCEEIASSQLAIGVHGSHLTLPSAAAKMFIELLPKDRNANWGQAVVPTTTDGRLGAFRCRTIPLSTSPKELAALAVSMIGGYPHVMLYHGEAYADAGQTIPRDMVGQELTKWEKLKFRLFSEEAMKYIAP